MPARNTFAATRRSHAILKRLRRGEGVTIQEVSDQYEIQYPQARADLKLLEELYGLETFREGRTKVWKLPGAETQAAAVGSAAALELGAVALDVFKDTPYGETIDELKESWRRRVGSPFDERFGRLSSALHLRRTWAPTNHKNLLEALETLLDCITLRQIVDIDYERSDDTIQRYELIPRRLIWYQGRLWLQAVDRGEEKLFDVAGILKASYRRRKELVDKQTRRALKAWKKEQEGDLEAEAVEEERERLRSLFEREVDGWFEYKEPEEEDRYFQNAFGIFARGFDKEEVVLNVRGPWAKYLRRYRLHESQENEELEEGLQVRYRLGVCPEFRSFVLGMLPDVEVKAPARLVEDLRGRTEEWLQRTQ